MMRRIFYWTILMILLFVIPGTVFCDVFFVSSNKGSDSNDGNEWSTPVKSLAHGLELTGTNDTLLVVAGDTLKGNWTITNSVSVWCIQERDTLPPYKPCGYFYMGPADGDEPTQVLLVTGSAVTFTLKNCVLDGNLQELAEPNGNGCFRANASAKSFLKNCTAKNFRQFGFRSEDYAEVTMVSCSAHNIGWSGFFDYVNGSMILEDCRSSESIYNGFSANGHILFIAKNCLAENNGMYGIKILGSSAHEKSALIYNELKGNVGGLFVEDVAGDEFTLEWIDIINDEPSTEAATFDLSGNVQIKNILVVGENNSGLIFNGSGTIYEISNITVASCQNAFLIYETANLVLKNSVIYSSASGINNAGSGEVVSARTLFWDVDQNTDGSIQNLEPINSNPLIQIGSSSLRNVMSISPVNFNSTVNSFIGILPENLPHYHRWGRLTK